jgi:hypothetical protein
MGFQSGLETAVLTREAPCNGGTSDGKCKKGSNQQLAKHNSESVAGYHPATAVNKWGHHHRRMMRTP